LEHLGRDFSDRGFTSSRVEFAVEFDKVIQDSMANSIIEQIYKTFKQTQEDAKIQKDKLANATNIIENFLKGTTPDDVDHGKRVRQLDDQVINHGLDKKQGNDQSF
jgi:hypothetical protein